MIAVLHRLVSIEEDMFVSDLDKNTKKRNHEPVDISRINFMKESKTAP